MCGEHPKRAWFAVNPVKRVRYHSFFSQQGRHLATRASFLWSWHFILCVGENGKRLALNVTPGRIPRYRPRCFPWLFEVIRAARLVPLAVLHPPSHLGVRGGESGRIKCYIIWAKPAKIYRTPSRGGRIYAPQRPALFRCGDSASLVVLHLPFPIWSSGNEMRTPGILENSARFRQSAAAARAG